MIVSVKRYTNNTFLLKAQLWLGFLFIFGLSGCKRSVPYYDITGNTMGTSYTIRLVHPVIDSVKINSLKVEIDSILVEINRQMSTYILNSEISLFNQMSENTVINISDGFAKVINRSIYWGEMTSGAFDISILPSVLLWRRGKSDREYEAAWEPPTDLNVFLRSMMIGYEKIQLNQRNLVKAFKGQMIDVNAIAKGWGVDQLFDFITDNGFTRFMVEVGGEVRTMGKNNKGKPWRIGIDTPVAGSLPGDQIYAIVSLSDQAMATSGNYRNFYEYEGVKYSHIIDPRTGAALESNILSVTVTGPNCMDADALATAMNVMTLEDGKVLVEFLDGFEALWIIENQDGTMKSIKTSGMQID
tara:strand:+ start:1924 stop:2994 length:1071 start_codon:yes stop_codon:yes gene_type:complete